MTPPAQHAGDIVDLGPRGKDGTVDHDHWQSQCPRRDQLGLGARAPGILAHHEVDRLLAHQRQVTLNGEGPTIDHDMVIGQADRTIGPIDEAQQIAMLRLRGERLDMHPPQRQHDSAWWPRQRGDRRVDIADTVPSVAVQRNPGRPRKGNMLDARLSRRGDGVAAHLRRERMRRVDQMRDARFTKIGRKTIDAAEPADPHGHGLWLGVRDATGIAEHRRQAAVRQRGGECAGFGRTAENEDGRHG